MHVEDFELCCFQIDPALQTFLHEAGNYQLTLPFTLPVMAFFPSAEKLQSKMGAGWLYWEMSWADGFVEMV